MYMSNTLYFPLNSGGISIDGDEIKFAYGLKLVVTGCNCLWGFFLYIINETFTSFERHKMG